MAQWQLDPAHTGISFNVRHMMVTTVRGAFNSFNGTLDFDPANPGAGAVNVTIDVASVNTGVEDRDNHLRSADFFDAENFTTITFNSTSVDMKDETSGTVTGDLTIRDITKSITLDVQYLGLQKNPFTGTETIGFEATAKINREDFGLTWNQTLETGGVLVGKDIKIALDAQAVPAAQPENA